MPIEQAVPIEQFVWPELTVAGGTAFADHWRRILRSREDIAKERADCFFAGNSTTRLRLETSVIAVLVMSESLESRFSFCHSSRPSRRD